MTTSAESSSK